MTKSSLFTSGRNPPWPAGFVFVVSAALGACGGDFEETIGDQEVASAAGLENVAQTRGKISGQSGFQTENPPQRIIDGIIGDDNNRWSVDGLPTAQWVEIDLGSDFFLSSVKLDTYQNRDYQFRVEVKAAGGTYATALNLTTNASPGPISGSLPTNTKARFVKLVVAGAKTYTGSWVSIRELQVLGQASEVDLGVASVTASANDGNLPANVRDGSFTTRWSAYGSGQWIQLNLSQTADIGKVAIAWYVGDTRSGSFAISVSANGAEFTEVYRGNSSGTTTQFESTTLKPNTAKYVRITGFGSSASLWNSITEIKLYGQNQLDDQGQISPSGIRHPGGLHTLSEIAFVRTKVAAGAQPWKSAYDALLPRATGLLSEVPSPVATFYVPPYYVDKPGHIREGSKMTGDTYAAYATALAWRLSGDVRYGNKAVELLLAWARTNTSISPDADSPLVSSYSGVGFIFSAELLEGFSGWTSANRTTFRNWVKNVYLPGAPNRIKSRLNNWGDWGILAAIASYHYLDDMAGVRAETTRLKSHIDSTVNPNGYMPAEGNRGAQGLWYTYFALAPMTAAAKIALSSGAEDVFRFVASDGSSIKKALDYYLYYAQHPSEWPWNTSSDPLRVPETWPANLFEAMDQLYSAPNYGTYAGSKRPIMLGAHHVAWNYPTLMKMK